MRLGGEEEDQGAGLARVGGGDVEVEDGGHVVGGDSAVEGRPGCGVGGLCGDGNDQMWEFVGAGEGGWAGLSGWGGWCWGRGMAGIGVQSYLCAAGFGTGGGGVDVLSVVSCLADEELRIAVVVEGTVTTDREARCWGGSRVTLELGRWWG